ncbi:MAG TPA: LTA synthase family protein, partial [Bacteroidetes bacterium]|nr:LTA synthase family protein [Bacteroidota bacterium]
MNTALLMLSGIIEILFMISFISELSFTGSCCASSINRSVLKKIKFFFSLSKYCTNKIDGLGSILNKEGYETSFFHGAPNGSMGFESLSNLFGITNYYGMDNYKEKSDFDGVWGVWDDKFFAYFADELNKMEKPFFSSIFSCSSHHPYKIPKKFTNKFKKGKHPMHECVQYT